jgi:hypothetical protein
MVEPTHQGMQVLTHLVFYKVILVCVYSVYFLVISTPIHGFCLEKLHRRPVIIRPASICTLSNKSDSFLVQLPHTTSPYSKTGLINAKYIRIREYLSNKCLTCLSKNKREHAFL